MLSRLAPLGGPERESAPHLLHLLVCVFVYMCVLSLVQPFVTSWTVACPWDLSGKNPRLNCHFLLWGIFLIQGRNPCLSRLLHLQADSLPLHHREAIAFGSCWWSLTCRCTCQITTSVITCYSPCVCMSMSKFPSSYKGTSHWIRDHSDPVWPLRNLNTSAKTLFPNKVRFSWYQELGLESVFWEQNSTHHTFFPMVSGPI